MSGKSFEEFRRGEGWLSPPRRVTRRDIEVFSRISRDRNPLHLDPVYAKGTPFKRTIAHGLLGLSMASGMLDGLGIIRKSVLAFVELNWRFLAPIYPGDRVRLKLRVARKKRTERRDRGIVIFQAELLNQDGRTVQEGDWTLLVYCKRHLPE